MRYPVEWIVHTLIKSDFINLLYHCNILLWKVSPNNVCFHFWTFFVIQFIYFWRYRVIIIVYFWYAFLIAYHPYPIKIHAWTFSIYEHLKKIHPLNRKYCPLIPHHFVSLLQEVVRYRNIFMAHDIIFRFKLSKISYVKPYCYFINIEK